MEKKKDLYSDYNHERYAHYRNMHTGKYEVQKVKSAKKGERVKPILKKVKVSFDEVKNLNLDKVGNVAPTLDTEDFTIVSNYLVDFWGAIMGDSAVSVYLHLKRHAYGKKDYCYVDIEMICLKMNKGRTAVAGYLKTLEEYGFIVTFLRKDITRNNSDASPLFKIRRYVPLLTKEMYDSLHPKLKALHDDFMSEYEGITLNSKVYKTDEIIENIVEDGEVLNNKEVMQKIDQLEKESKLEEYVVNSLSSSAQEFNNGLHEFMMTKLSKPSYETWIQKSIIIKKDDFNYLFLAPNEFAKQWVESRYEKLIKEYIGDSVTAGSQLSNITYKLLKDFLEKDIDSRAI
ncbi:helix-turn-helix domain-containing protein [Bacillus spizizenii]|nr:helix-turn-helix domain-containing protein [Bacillus spizizenii]MCY9129063.1 helix-turn-helix domain-containing protein [Bacillus spizizenii]